MHVEYATNTNILLFELYVALLSPPNLVLKQLLSSNMVSILSFDYDQAEVYLRKLKAIKPLSADDKLKIQGVNQNGRCSC